MAVGLLILLIALVVSIGFVALIAWVIYAAVASSDRDHSEAPYDGKAQSGSQSVLSGVALGCGVTLLIPFALIVVLILTYAGTAKVSYDQNRSADVVFESPNPASTQQVVRSRSVPPKAVVKQNESNAHSRTGSSTKNGKTKEVKITDDVSTSPVLASKDLENLDEIVESGPSIVGMGKTPYQSPLNYRNGSDIGSTRLTFFRLAAVILLFGILLFGARTISSWNRSNISTREWISYGHSVTWAISLFLLHLFLNFFIYEALDYEHYIDFEEAIVLYGISMIPFIGAYLVLKSFRVSRRINPEVGLAATIGMDILVFCGFMFLEFLVAFFFLEILDFEREGDEVCVGIIMVSSAVLLLFFLKFRGFVLERKQPEASRINRESRFGLLFNGSVFVALIGTMAGISLVSMSQRREPLAAVAADQTFAIGGKQRVKNYPKWVQEALKSDRKTPYRFDKNYMIVPSSAFASKNEAWRDSDQKLTKWVNYKFKKEYPDSKASFASWDIRAFIQSDYVTTSERKSLGEGLEATLFRHFQRVEIKDEERMLASMHRQYTIRESERRSYYVGFGLLAVVFVLGSTSFFLRRLDSKQNLGEATFYTAA